MRIALLLGWAAGAMSAAYPNLIATSDNTVFVEVQTGIVSTTWFKVRYQGGEVSCERVEGPLADVDGTAAVFARASYTDRRCGFSGSTCWLANSCDGVMRIDGAGISLSNTATATFVRLSRSGRIAWLEQRSCAGISGPRPPPTPLSGLYDLSSPNPIAARSTDMLANRRTGRRLVTDSGRALTFLGIQLQWVDAAGRHPIRHVSGAYEAVTDAAGANLVYVEDEIGLLHWIDSDDHALHLVGSAPALSDDGRRLAYLDEAGALRIYRRSDGSVGRPGSGAYRGFTWGSNSAILRLGSGLRVPGSGKR